MGRREDLIRYAEIQAEQSRRSNGGEMDLLTWTIINRSYLRPDSLFDLQTHPYLVDLYREKARHLVLYKSSQMGASEYAVSRALHAADVRQETVMYLFPTDRHITDFSTERLGGALEASPYLGSIVGDGPGDGSEKRRRGADRVTLKRIRNRFLYLRGGQVSPDGRAPGLKSVAVDLLVFDELDEMDQRAPAIALKRLGHSKFAEELDISTPTYADMGIDERWKLSDQREWFVPCPRCGELQVMTIQGVVIEWDALERPAAWHGMKEGRAFVACRRCGAELDRTAAGRWVPRFPGRDIVGYHLTKFFSPVTQLIDVVRGLQVIDETKRRECFNQDLGEVYTPRGSRIDDALLDSVRREYALGPVGREATVAGCDVGSLLHIVIRALPRGSEVAPLRWAGAVQSFEELAGQLRRFNVKTLVIDGLPETRKDRELQAQFPRGLVWLAFFGSTASEKKAEMAVPNQEEGTVTIDRTRAFDQMYAELMDGHRVLPLNIRDVPDYYEQMKAPMRVLEKAADGKMVARYTEGSKADHFALAEVYCEAALAMPRPAPLPDQAGVRKPGGSEWN